MKDTTKKVLTNIINFSIMILNALLVMLNDSVVTVGLSCVGGYYAG